MSIRLAAAMALCGCLTACATVAAPDRSAVSSAIAERAGVSAGALASTKTWTAPEGVNLADGVTQDEAIAIALWNNADFHAALTQLGIARADLIEAGLIRNPVLSLLFPLGPKQLEMTVNWPIDTFWQRPRRIADAKSNADAIAHSLTATGLQLVADVRLAYAEVTAADLSLSLGDEQARTARQLADIGAARLRAGDISEFDARLLRTDSTRVEAAAIARRSARDTAMARLRALMGIAPGELELRLSGADPALPSCGDMPALLKQALASRPEVRAAELQMEAAGARVGLEKNRIVTLAAILDANAEGKEGFEMGPGLSAELPIFSQNNGRRARAAAELDQAGRRYLAVRASVVAAVDMAFVEYSAAQSAYRLLAADASQSVARDRELAQKMYDAGEISLMNLLEARQRLNEFEQARLDAQHVARRAGIRLDQAVGRVCREISK